jgi:hypothetical protein
LVPLLPEGFSFRFRRCRGTQDDPECGVVVVVSAVSPAHAGSNAGLTPPTQRGSLSIASHPGGLGVGGTARNITARGSPGPDSFSIFFRARGCMRR